LSVPVRYSPIVVLYVVIEPVAIASGCHIHSSSKKQRLLEDADPEADHVTSKASNVAAVSSNFPEPVAPEPDAPFTMIGNPNRPEDDLIRSDALIDIFPSGNHLTERSG
jgi:hypothetical protein